jgi:hypothetical protein
MSEIKVNKISPKQTCTQVTLGDSGDTFTIPAGVTLTNSGTATGFGATGAVNWDTTPKTTTVTAVSGVGYFVDTTSGAITVNLPAGSAGDIVAISDYANTAATNNITIDPNGTDKINGTNADAKITTNGAAVTLIYVDSTIGWKDVNDATLDVTGIPQFVSATGGTVTCCGDYKIHTFTGPGTFTVTNAGTPAGSTTVDYLVVAGGGGGGGSALGYYSGGGGGAGGFRESVPSPAAWTASPLANPGGALPVSVQSYPIIVGAGGGGGTGSPGPSSPASRTPGSNGNNSVFSTITSTNGGGGSESGSNPAATPETAANGGSGGGGGGYNCSPTGGGGLGNTPPVAPPQGNNGGNGFGPSGGYGGGGGGAGGAGVAAPTISAHNAAGGPGVSSQFTTSPVTYAVGGNAGASPCVSASVGAANTGNAGQGGSDYPADANGGNGGSGIVIIRYKFQ